MGGGVRKPLALGNGEAPAEWSSDLDHDGIPDDKEPAQAHAWERAWKTDQRNALLDDNGNGQTNLDEYLAKLVQDLSPSDNP